MGYSASDEKQCEWILSAVYDTREICFTNLIERNIGYKNEMYLPHSLLPPTYTYTHDKVNLFFSICTNNERSDN